MFSPPSSPVLASSARCPPAPAARGRRDAGGRSCRGSRSFPPSLLRSVRALAKPAWTAKGSGEPGAVPAARQSHLTPHRVGRLPGAGAAADASARCRQPLTCLEGAALSVQLLSQPGRLRQRCAHRPWLGTGHRSAPLPSARSPLASISPLASRLRSLYRQHRAPLPAGHSAKAISGARAKQGSGGAAPSSRSVPLEGKAPGRLTNLSCPCSPSSSAPLFSASSAPRACLSRTGPRREQSLHPRASRQLGCGSRGHLSPSPNNSWRANKILKKPKKRPCGRATPASPRLQPSG